MPRRRMVAWLLVALAVLGPLAALAAPAREGAERASRIAGWSWNDGETGV